MNKKGKVKGATIGVTIGVLALVAILGLVVWQMFFVAPSAQSTIAGVPTGTGESTSAGCNTAPSIVLTATDAQNPGTAVSVSSAYRINGAYIGTTAPSTVGTADMLINSSYNYLAKVKSGVKVGCGSNLVTEQLLAYNNATLTYYSDDGLTKLVQHTANETAKSAGSTYNWKLHFQGTDKKSTGKMILIVEMSVPANVSSLTLSGGQEVAVPNGYSRQLTNGYAKAWKLPEIVGTTPVDYFMSASSSSSKIIQGTVYTTVIASEPFVETDGTFNDNGDAYDSLNTAKEHESYTKNFIIV